MVDNENQELFKELKRMTKLHFEKTKKILDDYGLYVGQPRFLFSLLEKEGLSQKDMAKKLEVQPATVNVTLKRLEKAGFVEKRFDDTNKRASKIYLTDKGRETCLSVRGIITELNNDIFSVLDEDEKSSLQAIIKKISSNIENNID